MSGAGEDYAIRQQRENQPLPENLRDQFLKYRVAIRILGVIRRRADDKEPVFIASHRRFPHVGAKVAFLGDDLLRQVSGATAKGPNAVEIGFLAFGEFVHAGQDSRVGDDDRPQIQDPLVLPRFDISQMVGRRTFVPVLRVMPPDRQRVGTEKPQARSEDGVAGLRVSQHGSAPCEAG